MIKSGTESQHVEMCGGGGRLVSIAEKGWDDEGVGQTHSHRRGGLRRYHEQQQDVQAERRSGRRAPERPKMRSALLHAGERALEPERHVQSAPSTRAGDGGDGVLRRRGAAGDGARLGAKRDATIREWLLSAAASSGDDERRAAAACTDGMWSKSARRAGRPESAPAPAFTRAFLAGDGGESPSSEHADDTGLPVSLPELEVRRRSMNLYVL